MTSPVVRLSELEGTSDDIVAVYRALAGASSYSVAISGSLPSPDDAASVFASLPPAVPRENKHVFGIYVGTELIGLADVLRGYPSPEVAYIGLLLISESFQRRGFGRSSFKRIVELATDWGCDRVRLAVVDANERVVGFWVRVGFTDTGARVPYRCGTVSSQSMIFEMVIPGLSVIHCPQSSP